MRTIHWLTLAGLISLLALTASGAAAAPNDPDKEEWIQLFNGRNLDGWDVKIRGYDLNDNFGDTFRVVDGMLTVSYDQYDKYNQRFGHIFHRGEYSHYRLVVEYRFIGEQAPEAPAWALRNSGAMIHGQPASTMGKDQDFPVSIEVQLLGGDGSAERSTANLCTPGTHVVMNGELVTKHCINSSSKTYHGEQWVRAEVVALGDKSIKHIVNGETVLEYEKPQLGGGNVKTSDSRFLEEGKPVTGGSISLQSESHPIQFRKVELLPLKGCMDKKAANFKSYYVEPDNAQCKY